ncbi:MAG: TonB-dependent receptor [Balneolales bacterium]
MLLRIRFRRLFPALAILLIFIFSCPAFTAWGFSISFQDPADTLYLDEVLIQSTRIREPIHFQPVDVRKIDSTLLAQFDSRSVAEILSRHSGLFIRDNGPGGLSTLSQRGLSPGQTEVLWEGFPVNSLSLGLSDLSLIPALLFQSVEVSPGTPSSATGGGSLGGTVWLSSHRSGRNNRINMIQSVGAYGTRNSRLHAGYTSDTWTASLQGNYHSAQNDFRYFNRATNRYEYREHNSGRSGHLMGSAGYRFASSRAYTSLWYLDHQQEIPGSVLTGSARAEQSNQTFRWLGGLEAGLGQWKLDVRGFLEHDRFHYEDPVPDIDSRFLLKRQLMEVNFRRPSTGYILWQGGLSGGMEEAETGNYADQQQRRLLGIRLNPDIRYPSRRLRFTPAVRMDAFTGFGWVLSPSLGANWEVFKERFFLKGMLSRDFNPPSFNDLYWAPGGNPNLKPEQSLRAEGGFSWLPVLQWIDELRLTVYRIRLHQGIYWFPQNNGIWSPANVEEVKAHGIEAGLELHHQIGRIELRWDSGLDRRIAEIASERFPGDKAPGHQMRYVPEWAYRSNLDIRISSLMMAISYRWTGQRYVNEDHTTGLEPFQVLDLAASMKQSIGGQVWHVRLTVNNVLGETYEVIQWYPMPGRHFTISLGAGIPY